LQRGGIAAVERWLDSGIAENGGELGQHFAGKEE